MGGRRVVSFHFALWYPRGLIGIETTLVCLLLTKGGWGSSRKLEPTASVSSTSQGWIIRKQFGPDMLRGLKVVVLSDRAAGSRGWIAAFAGYCKTTD